MKEKQSFKRFDLLSALAVLGVLLVLLFESIFIFELYNVPFEPLERLLNPAENPAPVDGEEVVPAENKEPAPADDEPPVPVEAEEPAPVG